jgi:two-component system LytT family sensor kinase
MQERLPITSLLRYSVRCSFAIACVVLITTFAVEGSWGVVVYRSFTTFLLFFISCLINIALIRIFEKRGCVVDPEFRPTHFLLGYFAVMAILVVISGINMVLIESNILPPNYMGHKLEFPMNTWMFWVHTAGTSLIVFVLVYYFHSFILLLFAKARTEAEIAELKAANFESANQLLRQQIQPHFLFNALNVLKSLIRRYPGTAEEYVIRLSDFLRASLTVGKSDIATMAQELKLCEDYMEMQKIRFGNSLHYTVAIDEPGVPGRSYLPVFSLQPLLENAIKHNQLTEASPLKIAVTRDGEWVEVCNNLQPKNLVEGSTGNGLFNLKERYRILSGDEVVIRMTKDVFLVRIKILRHEDSRN